MRMLSAIAMVAALSAAVSPSAAFAAQNTGAGPIVTTIGELFMQGYVCFQAENLSSVCIKGGSIYICMVDGTCIQAAAKIDPKTYKVPRAGVDKLAPAQ